MTRAAATDDAAPGSVPARAYAVGPAMTESTLTYETACARIEEIIRRLDSGEAGLRETLELCQEGRRLVEFCAGELEAVGQGLEELKLDELVARLETGGRAARVAAQPSSALTSPERSASSAISAR